MMATYNFGSVYIRDPYLLKCSYKDNKFAVLVKCGITNTRYLYL